MSYLNRHRGQLQAAVGGGHPVVRGSLLEQRVAGRGLDVELHHEVGDEHEGDVEQEVRGQDEEEGRGVVLRVSPGRSAQGLCPRLLEGGGGYTYISSRRVVWVRFEATVGKARRRAQGMGGVVVVVFTLETIPVSLPSTSPY